jgi:hypothetical protein
VRFRGDLTERREKLMQKTASVPVSFMEKGFYTTYTPYFTFACMQRKNNLIHLAALLGTQ